MKAAAALFACALLAAAPAPAAAARKPKATPSPEPSATETPAATPEPSAEDLDPVAIIGGTVWTMDGPPLEKGTVLFRDGKIVAVGRDIEIPGRARRIDATGQIVTPGLVDSSTEVGLTEIDAVPQTNDYGQPDGGFHSAFRVVDGLNPDSVVIAVTRMEGVTSAVSRPDGPFLSGQGAWIHLAGRHVEDMVVEASLGIWGALDEGAKAASGGTRSNALRRMRELFDDARLLRTHEPALEENRLRALTASRQDLEALLPVIDKKIPLVMRAARASDIEAVLRFAREEKIRVIIDGGAEAWRVADELAAAKVPVIVKPFTDMPTEFESLGSRFDNAALLDAAGVPIALTSGETHNVRVLRQAAGNAAAWGLPKEKAFAAITRAPAEVFGLASRLGTLTKGKSADLVIWSGDPLELSTQPIAVYIDGREIPRRSRQTELLDRYRTLPAR